ncbi:WD40 repeat domain-containing protein [Micromonospora sp. NPDC050417]|uniref:WD40 repeat domain-containing protein n=1 Tax=Micromonospora sp. NPDC050417 TaxID=3364280 RepID=UPI0037BBA495
MTDQRVSELFRGADPGDGPALPEGYAERLVAVGRRGVRRRRALGGSVVLVVLLAVGLLGLGPLPSRSPQPATAVTGVSLPDRLAPFSFRTGTIGDAPLDRAVMIFEYGSGETINVWQRLALGADGNSYRQLDGIPPGTPWLLTADGRAVVTTEASRATSAFTVLDLSTGLRHQFRLPAPVAVALLASSPDGRYVAYSATPYQGSSSVIGEVEQTARERGTLTLLDLTDGRTTTVTGVEAVSAAAFSPDGGSLAVQSGAETWIVDRAGQRLRRVATPGGFVLAPRVAWSPDGRLLAVQPKDSFSGTGASDPYEVRFVDAVADAPVPPPVSAEQLLGWRSPDRVLALTLDGISELPLRGGDPVVLTRPDRGNSCEYHMQPCLALEIRAATALLPTLTVRSGDDPDRGPWPAPVRQVVAVGSLLAAALAGVLVWRSRPRWSRAGQRGRMVLAKRRR